MTRSRGLRNALTAGAFLILLGGWLLARNLDLRVPGLEALWPALPLIYGAASLAEFFLGGRRRDDLVFTGLALGLAGAVLLWLNLTQGGWAWARWWPALVVAAGLAYLAQWLARPREWSRLILAGIGLIFGGLALAAAHGLLARDLLATLVRAWPALLILAGLGLLAQAWLQPRRP